MAKYPRTLSPRERAAAAKAIRAGLKGTTGQRRAEKRAELMEPGPGDDYEREERAAIQHEHEAPKGATAFPFGHSVPAKKLRPKKEKR
jgi:hypothetical protein